MSNIFHVSFKIGSFRLLSLAGTILLPLALVGCGGGSNGGGASTSTPAAPLSVSAVTPSGLTATLAENTAFVPVGGNVTYTVTLTNNSAQPVTFQAFGGDTDTGSALLATISAKNGGGTLVFPLSNNSAPAVGPSTTLAPGQSTATTLTTSSLGAVFTQPGSYSATATLVLYTGPAAAFGAALAAAQTTTLGPLPVKVQ